MTPDLNDMYNALTFDDNNNLTFSWNRAGSLTIGRKHNIPKIKKVVYNNPATIVIFEDGTKTVVKIKEGETFDTWNGLAMCIMKKMLGEEFHSFFRKWADHKVEKR